MIIINASVSNAINFQPPQSLASECYMSNFHTQYIKLDRTLGTYSRYAVNNEYLTFLIGTVVLLSIHSSGLEPAVD